MPSKIDIRKDKEYPGHRGSIYGLALSQDKRWLYSAGDDGTVAEWDLQAEGENGKAILRISGGIYALGLLEEKQVLVVGGSTGTIYFIDLASHRILHQYARTRDAIYGVWHHASSQTLWLLHGGGYLSILDADTFEELSFRRLAGANLRAVTADPEGGQIFIGASDHRIIVLDAQSFRLRHSWQAHENSVFALQLQPGRRHLISGGRDAHLKVWDLENEYQLIKSLPAHNFTVNDLALSPDRQYFATASRDKTVKVWNAETYELLKVGDFARHEGHTHSVNRLFWLTDHVLISCGDDRRIIRWQVHPGEEA
jgi:WD40 repeat protein